MKRPIRILLQTTILTTPDEWSIQRFSLLERHLSSLKDPDGRPLCQVMARDREPDSRGNDPVLSRLDSTEFDELWLFAVDGGNGLSEADCKGIRRFRERAGAILTSRDHQDLGSSLRMLGEIGAPHVFHTHQPDPDEFRRCIDDCDSKQISWPNYHSGRNGDYQLITPTLPLHPLLIRQDGAGRIRYFPAHPHEGDLSVPTEAPPEAHARVIATGVSVKTGRPFNLLVVMESYPDGHGKMGRVIADSSFHHYADYNWDVSRGAPSFVTESPGNEVARDPARLSDIHQFVRNVALWLAGRELAIPVQPAQETAPSPRVAG